ncbi:MAG: hypothetical protein AB1758_30795 [Candidatus Eremiobacterota bacterium]
MRSLIRIGALAVIAGWLVFSAVQAEPEPLTVAQAGTMIKTDGTNSKSPIKVTKLDFYDSTTPGANFVGEVRTSCTIQNSSKDKTLTKVTLTLMLNNLAGQSVMEWKKPVGTLKPGASFSFTPDPPIWYNYNKIQVQPKVLVEHELPPEETESPSMTESPSASPTASASPTPKPRKPRPKPTIPR